jgi:hypothetical protein
LAAAIFKAPNGLRNSILQDLDILRAKIGNQLLMFVARDEIEQNLLSGGT